MDAKPQEAPADTAAQAMCECDRLRDENAKLREYAKLMRTHIKVCCDACGECGFESVLIPRKGTLNNVMYVNEGMFNRLKETAANAIVERDQLKAENAKLWEYITWLEEWTLDGALMYRDVRFMMDMKRKELGIAVSE